MKKAFLILLINLITLSAFCQENNLKEISRKNYRSIMADKDEKLATGDSILNTVAHDFKFKTLKGDSIQLSTLKGKVVVMSAFFAVCYPCLKELVILEKLANEYENENVVFLDISIVDTPEILEKMKSHIVDKWKWVDASIYDKIIFVAASQDGEGQDGYQPRHLNSEKYKNETREFLEKKYTVVSVPVTFFIDKEGIIRFISRSFYEEYDYYTFYKSEIDALLKK